MILSYSQLFSIIPIRVNHSDLLFQLLEIQIFQYSEYLIF